MDSSSLRTGTMTLILIYSGHGSSSSGGQISFLAANQSSLNSARQSAFSFSFGCSRLSKVSEPGAVATGSYTQLDSMIRSLPLAVLKRYIASLRRQPQNGLCPRLSGCVASARINQRVPSFLSPASLAA